MSEIHAKPIVNGKLWVVEQDGEKVATLSKQENNKFKLSGNNGELWFDEETELLSKFGSKFFLSENTFKVALNQNECHGFPTKTKPYNTMYDVRRRLPLYTKQPQSKCFHCAGWYIVKFKNWVVTQCPKLITIERYEYHGPFKTKAELNKFKCNLK